MSTISLIKSLILQKDVLWVITKDQRQFKQVPRKGLCPKYTDVLSIPNELYHFSFSYNPFFATCWQSPLQTGIVSWGISPIALAPMRMSQSKCIVSSRRPCSFLVLGEQQLKSYFMNFPVALLFTENHQKPVSSIKESMTELPVHKVPLRLPRATGNSKA